MSKFAPLKRLPGQEEKHWLFAERTHVMKSLGGYKITAAEAITVGGLLVGAFLALAVGGSAVFLLGAVGGAVPVAIIGGLSSFALMVTALLIWRGKEISKTELNETLEKVLQEKVKAMGLSLVINGGDSQTSHTSK